MKKKTLLFGILFLFGCLLFVPEAKAAIASYTVRRTVGANVYNLKGSTTSSPVWLRLYQATVDGVAADTYCVDPGLKYGGNGTYYLYRYIDPTTNSPLDLAIAGALNEMENIRAEVTGNDSFQLVGTIAMRWIFMQYGGSRNAGTPELNRDYQAFRNNATAVSVNGNTAIIAYARQVYQAAKNAVAAGSYDNAVNQGLIWGPKFSTVEYTETYLTQTSRKVTFIIQTEDEFSTPDKFTEYIDSFTASCSNTSVTFVCSRVSHLSTLCCLHRFAFPCLVLGRDPPETPTSGLGLDATSLLFKLYLLLLLFPFKLPLSLLLIEIAN